MRRCETNLSRRRVGESQHRRVLFNSFRSSRDRGADLCLAEMDRTDRWVLRRGHLVLAALLFYEYGWLTRRVRNAISGSGWWPVSRLGFKKRDLSPRTERTLHRVDRIGVFHHRRRRRLQARQLGLIPEHEIGQRRVSAPGRIVAASLSQSEHA